MAQSVLIIDDHARFRSVARRALQGDSFDVIGEAADGADGLRAVAELRPDVVVLDVMLPDVSGLEVARRLRDDAPDSAVVLVSTHEEHEYEELAHAHGARGFLPKAELSRTALVALLRR